MYIFCVLCKASVRGREEVAFNRIKTGEWKISTQRTENQGMLLWSGSAYRWVSTISVEMLGCLVSRRCTGYVWLEREVFVARFVL